MKVKDFKTVFSALTKPAYYDIYRTKVLPDKNKTTVDDEGEYKYFIQRNESWTWENKYVHGVPELVRPDWIDQVDNETEFDFEPDKIKNPHDFRSWIKVWKVADRSVDVGVEQIEFASDEEVDEDGTIVDVEEEIQVTEVLIIEEWIEDGWSLDPLFDEQDEKVVKRSRKETQFEDLLGDPTPKDDEVNSGGRKTIIWNVTTEEEVWTKKPEEEIETTTVKIFDDENNKITEATTIQAEDNENTNNIPKATTIEVDNENTSDIPKATTIQENIESYDSFSTEKPLIDDFIPTELSTITISTTDSENSFPSSDADQPVLVEWSPDHLERGYSFKKTEDSLPEIAIEGKVLQVIPINGENSEEDLMKSWNVELKKNVPNKETVPIKPLEPEYSFKKLDDSLPLIPIEKKLLKVTPTHEENHDDDLRNVKKTWNKTEEQNPDSLEPDKKKIAKVEPIDEIISNDHSPSKESQESSKPEVEKSPQEENVQTLNDPPPKGSENSSANAIIMHQLLFLSSVISWLVMILRVA